VLTRAESPRGKFSILAYRIPTEAGISNQILLLSSGSFYSSQTFPGELPEEPATFWDMAPGGVAVSDRGSWIFLSAGSGVTLFEPGGNTKSILIPPLLLEPGGAASWRLFHSDIPLCGTRQAISFSIFHRMVPRKHLTSARSRCALGLQVFRVPFLPQYGICLLRFSFRYKYE